MRCTIKLAELTFCAAKDFVTHFCRKMEAQIVPCCRYRRELSFGGEFKMASLSMYATFATSQYRNAHFNKDNGFADGCCCGGGRR